PQDFAFEILHGDRISRTVNQIRTERDPSYVQIADLDAALLDTVAPSRSRASMVALERISDHPRWDVPEDLGDTGRMLREQRVEEDRAILQEALLGALPGPLRGRNPGQQQLRLLVITNHLLDEDLPVGEIAGLISQITESNIDDVVDLLGLDNNRAADPPQWLIAARSGPNKANPVLVDEVDADGPILPFSLSPRALSGLLDPTGPQDPLGRIDGGANNLFSMRLDSLTDQIERSPETGIALEYLGQAGVPMWLLGSLTDGGSVSEQDRALLRLALRQSTNSYENVARSYLLSRLTLLQESPADSLENGHDGGGDMSFDDFVGLIAEPFVAASPTGDPTDPEVIDAMRAFNAIGTYLIIAQDTRYLLYETADAYNPNVFQTTFWDLTEGETIRNVMLAMNLNDITVANLVYQGQLGPEHFGVENWSEFLENVPANMQLLSGPMLRNKASELAQPIGNSRDAFFEPDGTGLLQRFGLDFEDHETFDYRDPRMQRLEDYPLFRASRVWGRRDRYMASEREWITL
ncbi:MAG: hypothetical protein AAF658_16490, partial [Myxococcota bacterium]